MNAKSFLAAASLLVAAAALPAAIIGTNTPAQEITYEAIAKLPQDQQPPWKDYLDRSIRQEKADRAFLDQELKEVGRKEPVLPPPGRDAASLPLNRPDAWYASSNAQYLADNAVSFQTPAGGWSKNLSFASHPRAKGEHFAPDNLSRYGTPGDFDEPRDTNWDYVGTFDNDAFTTQMQFLAKTSAHGSPEQAKKWRDSFMRGVGYALNAQFPNGGWPQVWPLQGSYHDTVTYNDGAVLQTMELMRDISTGSNEFSFVPEAARKLAAASLEKSIQCTLAAQIVANGKLTVWCQQHNALDLKPASGRNYEMPSETSSESASVIEFLMTIPNPSPAIIASVDGAAAWFKKTQQGGRWPRYSEIGTDRPLFGDRDKTIHDTLSEISQERQRGYAWYRSDPQRALTQYAEWHAALSAPVAPK